jgi:hypothetical protein
VYFDIFRVDTGCRIPLADLCTPKRSDIMAMENFSKHQQKIIKRYYENIDQISLQRLSELVADLYLSEGKKREKIWVTAAGCMEKLGLPKARIDHIVAQNDPEILAKVVKELMAD